MTLSTLPSKDKTDGGQALELENGLEGASLQHTLQRDEPGYRNEVCLYFKQAVAYWYF